MIRADGGRVRDIGMTRNTQLSALLRLRRLIRDGRYDVVHAHLYRSQVYGRAAAWLAGTPVVLSTEHSIGETHLERRRMTLGVRALYLGTEMLSDMTVAVSGTVRERLEQVGGPAQARDRHPERGGPAAGGVRRDRAASGSGPSSASATDVYLIGVLGRLDPNKQFDMVIEAASAAARRQGQADDRGQGRGAGPTWSRRPASTAWPASVIFAGERHDVSAMLSAMDLFVASSRQETFGLSVLEALANGAPVLYTTCPALDGLDAERATRVPSTADGIRAAMAAEVSRRPAAADRRAGRGEGVQRRGGHRADRRPVRTAGPAQPVRRTMWRPRTSTGSTR